MTSIRKTQQADLFDQLYAKISGQVTEEWSASTSGQNHTPKDHTDAQASRQSNHTEEPVAE